MASYDQELLNLAMENKKGIERFARWRPSVKNTYDDLIRDIKSGELNVNWVPEDEWDAYARNKFPEDENLPGGWYQYSDESIHVPDSEWGREEALPHELMHYFAGHRSAEDTPEGYSPTRGTPKKINPYIKLDMDLGGWLPSLHPGGRRPELPGKTKLGQWWNDNMATKSVKYSDDSKYHPWFDEHAFNTALGGHGHSHGDESHSHENDGDHNHNKTNRSNNMANRFTDDQGLFQGGKYGRFGGRFRDYMERTFGNQDRIDQRNRNRLGRQMDVDNVPDTYMRNRTGTKQQMVPYSREEEYFTPLQKTAEFLGDYSLPGLVSQFFTGEGLYDPEPYTRTVQGERMEDVPYNYQEEADLTQDVAMARGKGGAMDFDPSDAQSVRQLQRRLNLAGYTDSEGNALEEDGMFGAKTESALRSIQKDLNPQDTRFGFSDMPAEPSQYVMR